jgi:hypothetical protein
MHWIAGANGTGSPGAITLSSIPQTFTHLQLRGSLRSAGVGSQIYTRLNGDSGSNYSNRYIYSDGSGSHLAGGATNDTVNFFGSMPASTDTANSFCSFIIDLLDYSNTSKFKSQRNISGYDLDTSLGLAFYSSALWRNTAAVNSITVVANASFSSLSRVDLYGITSNPVATGA